MRRQMTDDRETERSVFRSSPGVKRRKPTYRVAHGRPGDRTARAKR
ncbi:MAG: hypothetical protein LBD06_01360 [Candidatus Accumulibacter sp.]|nr:hypothetical protein [Accumulibacter sp.]